MQNKPCGCTTDCGCCSGTKALTPMPIANRPGLAALAYRVGTHATFVETMKARLASAAVDVQRSEQDAAGDWRDQLYPLQGLTTRTADDPAIALLDSWLYPAPRRCCQRLSGAYAGPRVQDST